MKKFLLPSAAAAFASAMPLFAQFPANPAAAGFPGLQGALPASVAPEDLPYTNNVVANPGFEKGFASDTSKGWVETIRNAGEAKAAFPPPNANWKPFEGKKSLHMKVKSPVKFSPKDLNNPSFGDFVMAANGKKGETSISVKQKIPVKPGFLYALRFRWRAQDLRKYSVDPGPERGYAQIDLSGRFLPAKGKKFKDAPNPLRLKPLDQNASEWQTFAFPDLKATVAAAVKAKKEPRPNFIVAPPEAGFLEVEIKLHSCTPNLKPEAWFDQFELGEINPADLKAALEAFKALAK